MKKMHLILIVVAVAVAALGAYLIKLNRESKANEDEKIKFFAQDKDIVTLFIVLAGLGVAAGFIGDKLVKGEQVSLRRAQ
jgi:uncharacterized membrane protein